MDKYLKRSKKEVENERFSNSSSCEEADSKKICSPQVKPKTKFSMVWGYFAKSADKRLAKCLTCGKEYKTSGNTSNLRDHLKRFHPDVDSGMSDAATSSSFASSSRQSSTRHAASYLPRAVHYETDAQRKKNIDHALATMIATDYQPLNLVENEGFKHFVEVLDPRYVLPSAKTVKNVLLKNRYDMSKNKLREILSHVSYVGITCDCWTSLANENYMTVTCHFIDKYFVLQSTVLSTMKLNDTTNHSPNNIASSLRSVFDEWSIFDKVICIVTDNSHSMIGACNLLEKSHMPCVAHTLNLVVQDALKGSERISNLRKKCKGIVTFFKSNTIAYEKFKIEQQSGEPLSLLQEVSTRWNSVYQMFSRLVSTNKASCKVLLSTLKAPSPITAYELRLMNDINAVLKLFADATEKISGSKYVTISLVIPLVFGMYQKIMDRKTKMETSEGTHFCHILISGLQRSLGQYERRSITRIATILDPRFKTHAFQFNSNMEASIKLVEDEVEGILRGNVTVEDIVEKPSTSSGENSCFFDFLEARFEDTKNSCKLDATIPMRLYFDANSAARDDDPLIYWKLTAENLSPLKECVQKYFCIPATSVEAERIFSKAGLNTSERRSRLKPKQVNIVIFLNKNRWLIEN